MPRGTWRRQEEGSHPAVPGWEQWGGHSAATRECGVGATNYTPTSRRSRRSVLMAVTPGQVTTTT